MTSCTTSTSCRTPSQTHPRSTPPPPEYEARAARKPWEEGHTCTPLDCFRAFFTLEMEDLIVVAERQSVASSDSGRENQQGGPAEDHGNHFSRAQGAGPASGAGHAVATDAGFK